MSFDNIASKDLLDLTSSDHGICNLNDRDGNTIASSNRNSPDSFIGQSHTFGPYFQQAIKGDPTAFLGYMALGVTSGKRGIYYSHPVHEDGPYAPIRPYC